MRNLHSSLRSMSVPVQRSALTRPKLKPVSNLSCDLLLDVRVSSGDAIAAGVEDQRFTVRIVVFFHLPENDDVIAAIVLPDLAALELRDHAM